MSEEFKPIRITLSEEAFDRMEKIMTQANFRSYSSTIEECIRAVADIIREVYIVAGERDAPDVYPTDAECMDSLNRIVMRMNRFTKRILIRKTLEK